MLWICLGDKLYLAPIGKDPGKVLDVGTGTGIWAIEFGDIHPSAYIFCTDLSGTQTSWYDCSGFPLDKAGLPTWTIWYYL